MTDKFEKLTIYSVDCEIEGEAFTFKPLPFKFYPDMYYIMSFFAGSDPTKQDVDLAPLLANRVAMEKLFMLESEMVKTSYPSMQPEQVEAFVRSNTIELIEPLFSLISRSSKADARRFAKAENGIAAKS